MTKYSHVTFEKCGDDESNCLKEIHAPEGLTRRPLRRVNDLSDDIVLEGARLPRNKLLELSDGTVVLSSVVQQIFDDMGYVPRGWVYKYVETDDYIDVAIG